MKSKLLRKATSMLEIVSESDAPLSLKELEAALGLGQATASRIASDLVESGLLRKISYRNFAPGLGLIRLGQRASLNYAFLKKVNRLLDSRARGLSFGSALAGVAGRRLVYLFNSLHDDSPGRLGLPYSNTVCNSNIALVSLACSLGRKKAMTALRESLRSEGADLPFKAMLESYSKRIDMLESEGFSLLDGGSFWNCCVPLRWRSDVLGLALYAAPAKAVSKDRLVSETRKLLADVEELLLNVQ